MIPQDLQRSAISINGHVAEHLPAERPVMHVPKLRRLKTSPESMPQANHPTHHPSSIHQGSTVHYSALTYNTKYAKPDACYVQMQYSQSLMDRPSPRKNHLQVYLRNDVLG